MLRLRMSRQGGHQVKSAVVVGIERARDVGQGIVQQRLEQDALFVPLTDDAGLALSWDARRCPHGRC